MLYICFSLSLSEFEVYQSFVAESVRNYKSEPAPLISVEDVNQWVEDTTKGHMTNFLPSIPHDVVLMLINAVYFKGKPFHSLFKITSLKLYTSVYFLQLCGMFSCCHW